MVAYTTEFCLPYLEGTDSLCLNTGTVCDPSSTWCDLIALVDAQLSAVDDVVARTGAAIPLARISYVPDTPIVLPNNIIPFNVVDIDTDDMVDLPTFVGIIPRRNGVYELILDIKVVSTTGVNDVLQGQIQVGNEAVPTIFAAEFGVSFATVVISAASQIYTMCASALWEFTDTAPVPRTVFASIDSGPELVESASLTVMWHSDVTT